MDYRTYALPCPACGVALERRDDRFRGCPSCRGLWVDHPTLSALFTDMLYPPRPVDVPFEPAPTPRQGEPAHRRRCPECRETLALGAIGVVVVDQCATHGVWFDPRELEVALETGFDSARPPWPEILGQVRR